MGGPPLFVSIPAIAVSALLFLPLGYLLLRASGASTEVWEALLRPRTGQILINSVVLVAAVVAASALIAVPMAWLTVRSDVPLRRTIAVLGALPLVVPSYIGAYLFVSALGPRGVLYDALAGGFGVEKIPDIYGFSGAFLSLTLLSYPYLFLAVRAALWRVDAATEEAAISLGADRLRTTLRVTLPLLRPAIAGGSLLIGLYTLSDFGAVSLMRYETFTWAIYLQYRSALDRSGAAVLSLVLVSLALLLLVLEARSRGAAPRRVAVGVSRGSTIVELGRWRWPAFAACALVIGLALVLPAGVLVHWVVRGVAAGEQLDAVWAWAGGSLYVSALAAVTTTLAALPIAVLAVRYASALGQWSSAAAQLSFALPGIVIALALVFVGAQYAPMIYQTVALLIAAYIIHFISSSLTSIRTSLLAVDRSVEEAARGLGATPLRVFLRVTLPLILPGMFAGAAMVFLLTMKELPATLLLAPLGFKTLATSLWGFAEAAFFARTAFPALVLLLVSSVPMAILVFLEQRAVR